MYVCFSVHICMRRYIDMWSKYRLSSLKPIKFDSRKIEEMFLYNASTYTKNAHTAIFLSAFVELPKTTRIRNAVNKYLKG